MEAQGLNARGNVKLYERPDVTGDGWKGGWPVHQGEGFGGYSTVGVDGYFVHRGVVLMTWNVTANSFGGET